MDAIDPRGNVINIVGIGENPSGDDVAVLANNTTQPKLTYIPPLMQLVGENNGEFYKVKTNTDGSLI